MAQSGGDFAGFPLRVPRRSRTSPETPRATASGVHVSCAGDAPVCVYRRPTDILWSLMFPFWPPMRGTPAEDDARVPSVFFPPTFFFSPFFLLFLSPFFSHRYLI